MVRPAIQKADDDTDSFCAVCGVPLKKSMEDIQGFPFGRLHDNPRHEWWPEAIGFRFMPTDRGESRMETYRPETEEFYFYPEGYRPPQPPYINDSLDEFPCIALHQRCFTMMQRIVDHRQSLIRHDLVVDGPRSLEDFWRVFCSRLDLDNRGMAGLFNGVHQPRLLEPHEYFFQPAYRLMYCYMWPTCHSGVIQYEVPPYPIHNLTYEIASFLKPLLVRTAEGSELCNGKSISKSLNRLPIELQEGVYCNLYPFVNVPVECTRQLPADAWRTLLFRGNLFPWLWDLDSSVLQSSPRINVGNMHNGDPYDTPPVYGADNYWDWEQLVRQLAQVDAFETGHSMEHAPLELRNRRRIWRLLDEARLDDIQEYARRIKFEQWEREMGRIPPTENSQSS